ncbi:MAG: competence/damage-inducible protein A [Candidatus Eremiobacteraeota bacterium]|nr:competence/damage-inducible protein A [Candidatus Eremiobacteraeota bacterium]
MPSVEIVTIGTEILLGQLVDTNSVYIARVLADVGLDVYAKHSVGDNAARLEAMLRGALERADGVVATGGLGPTVDDLTKDAVGAAVGTTLALDEPSVRDIQARFASLGRSGPVSQNNLRQAMLPKGCVVLRNPHGTAPGFVALRADGKFVACMPGVPREMKPMLAEQLVPWLVSRYGAHDAIFTRTLHTVGIGESDVDTRIEPLFRSLENPKIAVLAHDYKVDVKIMAKASDRAAADALIAPVETELRARIGQGIFGVDEETLESALLRLLTARGVTLGTAESITGGALADAFVRVPGASLAFRGGIVAYDNAVKTSLLGVSEALLREHGAVSEPVAAAMAEGACARLDTDFAVATTGIAGPAGATPGKPVGLVYIAIGARGGETSVRRLTFPGSRSDVRGRATVRALNLLWLRLDKEESVPVRASK